MLHYKQHAYYKEHIPMYVSDDRDIYLKLEQSLVNSFRRLLTLLLAITVAGTAMLRESTHSVVLTIILALASSIVVIVYAGLPTGDNDVSLLPAAVAAEAILALYALDNVTAQLLYTGIVCVLLFFASSSPFAFSVLKDKAAAQPDPWLIQLRCGKSGCPRPTLKSFQELANSVLYQSDKNLKYYWAAVRALIFTLSYANGTKELWFVAQLVLVFSVMLLATNDAAFDPQNNEPGSMTRTYLCAVAVSVVLFMYAFENVIPARASLIVIAIPILYVANQSIPSAVNNKPNPVRAAVTLATVTALLLYSLTFSNNVYYGSVGGIDLQGSERCSSLLNHVECHGTAQTTVGKCCCKPDYVPFQILHGTSHYGCIPLACQPKAIKNNINLPVDCCGVALTEGSKTLVAGSHLCACSNRPGNLINTVTNKGTCKCAAGLTGKYCEYIK